jgi:hypothetical protein
LFDHEAQLGGVVKSVVNFFLRVFGVHATPTLVRGRYSCQHDGWRTLARSFGAACAGWVLDGVAVVLRCSWWDQIHFGTYDAAVLRSCTGRSLRGIVRLFDGCGWLDVVAPEA